MTTGRITMGLSLELLTAYHRSSGGMRLVRDFSSSAASRESSVRRRALRSLLDSKELEPCSHPGDIVHSPDMHKAQDYEASPPHIL